MICRSHLGLPFVFFDFADWMHKSWRYRRYNFSYQNICLNILQKFHQCREIAINQISTQRRADLEEYLWKNRIGIAFVVNEKFEKQVQNFLKIFDKNMII